MCIRDREIHYPEINAGADAVELRVKDNFSYTDAIKALSLIHI